MTEIQRADPRRRRSVFFTALTCVLIGAILIAAFGYYREDLDAWLSDTPAESGGRFAMVLAAMAVLQCVPLLGLAVYFLVHGFRVVRARRFPLPGALVVHDTLVLHDRDAIRRGRMFQALASAFAVSALGVLYGLWWLWSLLPGRGV